MFFNPVSPNDIPFLFQEIKSPHALKSGILGKYSEASCSTCMSDECNGHVGYIKLGFCIMHPVLFKFIPKILSCICRKCNVAIRSRYITWDEHYSAIMSKGDDLHCNCETPTIHKMVFAQEFKNGQFSSNGYDNLCFKRNGYAKNKELYNLDRVRELFSMISNDVMGFDKRFKPHHLITNYVLVLPNVARSGLKPDGDLDPITELYTKIFAAKEDISVMNIYLKILGTSASETPMIKQMLTGKGGLMRASLMAARQNRSARSVISPNSYIPLHEIGVPDMFKRKLTVFEYVPKGDLRKYMEYIRSSIFVSPGNVPFSLSMSNESIMKILEACADGEYYTERELRNGDWVYVNRQPTLHRHSILAFNARLITHRTITLNLACVSAFNADFDGDEMTLYVASDMTSRAECQCILGIEHNMLSPENGKLVIHPVQDTITGIYKMTTHPNVTTRNNASSRLLQLFPMLPEGIIDKDVLFKVILDLHADNPRKALDFITDIQIYVDKWIKKHPITVGFFDFCPFTNEERDVILNDCYFKRKHVIDNLEKQKELYPQYSNQLENIICMFLDANVKGSMLTTIKDKVKDNDLMTMVASGAKGKQLDLVQSWVALCQQYVNGRQESLGDDDSKGFVTDCYSRGLSSTSAYYQATAARATIINTGVNTADPGYLYHQLSKFMSGVKVEYDGSVTNHDGTLL